MSSDKDRERSSAWRKKNPRWARDQQLRFKFGITIDDYEKLLTNQKFCCAICERHMSEFKRSLAVDHNHSTGQIRGLLCLNCNNGIGKLKDDIQLLEKAIRYLKKYG